MISAVVRRVVQIGLMVAIVPVAFVFLSVVDLKPEVGQDFFFASDNAAFREAKEIREIFPVRGQIVISAAYPDISSDDYFKQIEILSEKLLAAPGVTSIKSLSHGPGSYEEAADSPLWTRLLFGTDKDSTLLIVFFEPVDNEAMIALVEEIVAQQEVGALKLRIAGPPYVVEQIRRGLTRDMKTFAVAAVAAFAVMLLIIYRSPVVLIGTLVACAMAIMLTLITQSLAGQGIGVLTANLATIVFVLTLSHVIFLIANWREVAAEGAGGAGGEGGNSDGLVRRAVRRTFTASFWCMVTTALGFASLFLVDAKPLRELGLGGSIGTVMAIASAYLVFPAFLALRKAPSASGKPSGQISDDIWAKRNTGFALAGAAVCLALVLGVPRLNTDPSLLSYFAKDSKINEGMAYIDENGGSSPLKLVVSLEDGGRLDNSSAYDKLWALQESLSGHPDVGTVISLPVLMAEGDQHPLAVLLTWKWLLDILSSPRFEGVARTFVTDDRTQALFLLRMKEVGRDRPRVEVVTEVEDLVRNQGFTADLTGGVYQLQGQLAQLVGSSLFQGLMLLVGLFAIVAAAVARSFRVALAMVGCLALLPVALLGGLGLLRVPIDIISAPAANVAIGMAVDAMIHLTTAARRAARGERIRWRHWVEARQSQWRPTLISAVVIGVGFAIFGLSEFPPSQRFGLSVVAGALLAAAIALFLLPVAAARQEETKS